MVRPCVGKDPLSPFFNYLESNNAGMLGKGSLLNKSMGGRVVAHAALDLPHW